ncbi:D-alanine--D-alanine ligase [Bacillus sp. HMF5848]|uniref:D-alanine--D-alanine ligase n=1 Tax=Bacillus sp. HMF5848 TaxID=2495421 RepID=UPI000F7B29CC|nr:D-alanine--D-alanine ligase [Bacillus sp. HMF5848]RSK25651.1 D-alanine--D-alanine ligase [Bacillus sp. HMF5848]
MKTKIAVLYGGKSAEHKVSMQTALSVINALDQEKFEIHPVYITDSGTWVRGEEITGQVNDVKRLELAPEKNEVGALTLTEQEGKSEAVDVVFPLLHGPNGEDGTVQGMLELLNIPYVGNGVLASAAGMDKVIMKAIFAQAGLAQVNYVHFVRRDWERDRKVAYDKVEQELSYPCFVKPANLGSSVGISKCRNREELEQAFIEAYKFDRKVIVERGVTAREIEVAVLGNDDPKCSVIGEIVPKKDFYDYKAKYEDGDTALIIPAEISADVVKTVNDMATQAFKALDCSGLVRADFFLTKDGTVLINEVNTMPGFTPFSMFPLLWKHAGLEYPALIEELVKLALERYDEKQQITYTF